MDQKYLYVKQWCHTTTSKIANINLVYIVTQHPSESMSSRLLRSTVAFRAPNSPAHAVVPKRRLRGRPRKNPVSIETPKTPFALTFPHLDLPVIVRDVTGRSVIPVYQDLQGAAHAAFHDIGGMMLVYCCSKLSPSCLLINYGRAHSVMMNMLYVYERDVTCVQISDECTPSCMKMFREYDYVCPIDKTARRAYVFVAPVKTF